MNDPNTERRRLRRRIRAAAKAQAYSLIATLPAIPDAPITTTASDGETQVKVTVLPKGVTEDTGGAPEGVAGVFFSPLEMAIVNALKLAGDTALSGKVLAKRVSQPYATPLKLILRNLKDRKVLAHLRGEGYRLLKGTESRA